MDLKQYFRKIREIEATITDAHTFVSSLETSDGGKAGIISEVSRNLAAKMIVEGSARLASKEERENYLEQQTMARNAAQQAEMARRLQVTIVSDSNSLRPTQPTQGSSTGPKK